MSTRRPCTASLVFSIQYVASSLLSVSCACLGVSIFWLQYQVIFAFRNVSYTFLLKLWWWLSSLLHHDTLAK